MYNVLASLHLAYFASSSQLVGTVHQAALSIISSYVSFVSHRFQRILIWDILNQPAKWSIHALSLLWQREALQESKGRQQYMINTTTITIRWHPTRRGATAAFSFSECYYCPQMPIIIQTFKGPLRLRSALPSSMATSPPLTAKSTSIAGREKRNSKSPVPRGSSMILVQGTVLMSR